VACLRAEQIEQRNVERDRVDVQAVPGAQQQRRRRGRGEKDHVAIAAAHLHRDEREQQRDDAGVRRELDVGIDPDRAVRIERLVRLTEEIRQHDPERQLPRRNRHAEKIRQRQRRAKAREREQRTRRQRDGGEANAEGERRRGPGGEAPPALARCGHRRDVREREHERVGEDLRLPRQRAERDRRRADRGAGQLVDERERAGRGDRVRGDHVRIERVRDPMQREERIPVAVQVPRPRVAEHDVRFPEPVPHEIERQRDLEAVAAVGQIPSVHERGRKERREERRERERDDRQPYRSHRPTLAPPRKRFRERRVERHDVRWRSLPHDVGLDVQFREAEDQAQG
jgi:hypothetical protein